MKEFRSGNHISQGTFKSFQPERINRSWTIDNMELLNLLGQADRLLGKLDMYSEYIPNIDLFINMHVSKEATQSSKIEGTKTNIEEALMDKEDIKEERRNDWEEVQNYIEALNSAIQNLNRLPFSSRLIKETHRILLKGVRGEHKQPGEFRTSQNWIGGASISDATFIPPHHSSIHDNMSDLEKFAHNEIVYFPELLKIALIHYQFETIHPFLDGNGRVGRLLITLYLVEHGILKNPVLYLSDFFERNRMLYYDNLTLARERNDIEQWFKFFLVGIIETSQKSISTFDGILKLQKVVESKLQKFGSRTNKALLVMNHLYKKPVVSPHQVKAIINQSLPSVYKLINDLEKMGILHEITGGKRGKLYVFKDYIDLFK
ncbi:MAG: Fic family protein [Bacteroidales bacterium]|nr:Fic family protein [Bacteroidales bacterium]